MMLIDTDVLAIYHIFLSDRRHEATASFIDQTKEKDRSTSVYNLLELVGVISTAGKAKEAEILLDLYLKAGDINIIYPDIPLLSSEEFWVDYVRELRDIMLRGVRYGDAKIIWVAESNECGQIVTWNKKHYVGKTDMDVMDPSECLEK